LYGHVKTNSSASNASTDDAEVPSQASIKSLYDTVVSNKSATDTALSGKAPTSHASSDTTYGVGSSTNYGHLKVNDNYNDSSQESGGKAANAVSASSWAVKRCYDALKSICDGKLASGHADEKATASKYSHVMLSDAYTSSGGAASAGVGASSKAVYDSYTALNKSISTINSTITTMKSDFQAGVDKIYNACKTYGSTPSASTPAACETSIKAIYDARYTSGYNAGVTAGKSSISITRLSKSINVTTDQVSSKTVSITEYSNYKNISASNIIISWTKFASYPACNPTISFSYDNSSGIITISSSSPNAPFRYFENGSVSFDVVIIVC
jgi:hypothetical protein